MTDQTYDKNLIVTLDGPAGAGKSTVARELASRLGTDFLDTGAMYRGVTAAAIARGIDTADDEAVAKLASQLKMRFNWQTDPPTLLVNDEELTHRLRDADVTKGVSDIACNSGVRVVMVKSQQQIGLEHPHLVTEGRDQGSVVFPDATVKFYLDATAEERARRRVKQLHEMGKSADEKNIYDAIVKRDYRDMNRKEGPLVCPDGAIRMDTSDMNFEQVVQTLLDHVQRITEGEQC